MKTKVFLKTVALSAVILFGGIAASAANKNNLIYNSEEKDGVMVGQPVYKMDGGTLANYMWNNKQKAYVLVPEMTVTMDNPNL